MAMEAKEHYEHFSGVTFWINYSCKNPQNFQDF